MNEFSIIEIFRSYVYKKALIVGKIGVVIYALYHFLIRNDIYMGILNLSFAFILYLLFRLEVKKDVIKVYEGMITILTFDNPNALGEVTKKYQEILEKNLKEYKEK